jgi:hypothetical protein
LPVLERFFKIADKRCVSLVSFSFCEDATWLPALRLVLGIKDDVVRHRYYAGVYGLMSNCCALLERTDVYPVRPSENFVQNGDAVGEFLRVEVNCDGSLFLIATPTIIPASDTSCRARLSAPDYHRNCRMLVQY